MRVREVEQVPGTEVSMDALIAADESADRWRDLCYVLAASLRSLEFQYTSNGYWFYADMTRSRLHALAAFDAAIKEES